MLPTIAQHARQHGIEPLKRLGQNFLFDQTLCDKIAGSCKISPQDIVFEIGPGTAGLTRSILRSNPLKLISIETDSRCLSLLEDIRSLYKNFEIIEADALKVSLLSLAPAETNYKIIANLPYNIGTALILKWLKELERISSINVMVQREVADRICAIHSCKAYGRLSIICQLLTEPKKLFDISPDSFYPKPKIWSSFISLIPKKDIPTFEEISVLEEITAAAFGMRRKMLRSSLKSVVSEEILGDINSSLRAENLAPIEYLTIAKKVLTERVKYDSKNI